MKLLITRIAFVMAFAALALGPRALRAEPRPAAPQSQPGDPLLAIPPPGSPELSAYCARVKEGREGRERLLTEIVRRGGAGWELTMAWAYDLVRPWSAQGELLSLGYPAIPPSLNELADPRLKPDRRAVVLSVLFSLTGQNDPRVGFRHGTSPDMEVLGDLDGVDGTWTALGEGECRGQVGHEHIEDEQIDEAKQKEFASRWDRWKDFVRVTPRPQTQPAP